MIGKIVGNYEVVELLGRDEVADLYLAHHAGVGKNVLVRMLRTEHATDVTTQTFFDTVKRLNEGDSPPGLDPIDFGATSDGRLYAIFTAGKSLDELRILFKDHLGATLRAASV